MIEESEIFNSYDVVLLFTNTLIDQSLDLQTMKKMINTSSKTIITILVKYNIMVFCKKASLL